MPLKPVTLKMVTVGDRQVGKTAMLIAYTTNRYPSKYLPVIFDNYDWYLKVNGKSYVIGLNDIHTNRGFDHLRTLSYPQTDVFLLCFSVDKRASLSNVTSEWLPELHHHCPGVPIILVAMKTDLRTGDNGQHCIPFETGYNVAKHNHMYYMETSTLMLDGLKDLFDNAVKIGANAARSHKKPKKGPIPPLWPLPAKVPFIEIKTSVYGDQMATALQNPQPADVVFLLEGVKQIKAHRVVLCSACNYFCQVFGIGAPIEHDAVKIPFAFTRSDINEGKVAGLSSIAEIEDDGHQMTHITVSEDITFNIFSHVLEFLYTGLTKLEEGVDDSIFKELRRVANIFHLPHLEEIANNIQYADEVLNPSIGTYLNDKIGRRAKALFLGKDTFSDVKFNIKGTVVPAHTVMLTCRCDVMTKMFRGVFAESSQEEVTIEEGDQEGFLALLEYLYTDHAPIEEGDSVGILTMADKYGQERLKNLCELYITREIDRTVRDRIAKAKLDVIMILHRAQFHHAEQLAKWCLHFISTNYQAFTERPEFSQLDGDSKEYVNKNRWPPVSYLEEMKAYEAFTQKKKEKCELM